MVALSAGVHALSFTCTLNMFLFEGTCTRSRKKGSVGLRGKSRTVDLRCRGGHNSKNRGCVATLGNRDHQSLSSVSNFFSHKAFKMKSRCLLTGLGLPRLLLSCLFPKRPMGRTPRPTYQKGSISGPGIQSIQWGCTTALGGSEHVDNVSLLGAQEKKKGKGHSQTQLTGAFWGLLSMCRAQRKRIQLQN